jgi:nitric oxide reductase large subunit
MSKQSNSSMKVISIVLLIVGIGLAVWGYQVSGSFGSQLNNAINGSPTDKVMMLYIGGAVSFVIGLYLLVRK